MHKDNKQIFFITTIYKKGEEVHREITPISDT